MAQSTPFLLPAVRAAIQKPAALLRRMRRLPRPGQRSSLASQRSSRQGAPGFAEAVGASEALREAARQGSVALNPALSGCRPCRTAQMIASPMIGRCAGCGAEFTVLTGSELGHMR